MAYIGKKEKWRVIEEPIKQEILKKVILSKMPLNMTRQEYALYLKEKGNTEALKYIYEGKESHLKTQRAALMHYVNILEWLIDFE